MRHTLTQVQSIPVLKGKAQAFFDQPGGGVQWMVDESKLPNVNTVPNLVNAKITKWDMRALELEGYIKKRM